MFCLSEGRSQQYTMKLYLVVLSTLWFSATAFTTTTKSVSSSRPETSLLAKHWNGWFADPKPSGSSGQKTAVIAGATGYIGKSTVREAVRQGYKTYALVRDASKLTTEEGKVLFAPFLATRPPYGL